MPRLEHLQAHPLSVPGIVPAFLAVVLMIFGDDPGGALRQGRGAPTSDLEPGGHARHALANPGNRRLLITACADLRAMRAFLVGRTPYRLATGLFIFVFVVVFEWRRGMSRPGSGTGVCGWRPPVPGDRRRRGGFLRLRDVSSW
ncbi:MAG: hypothetical protein MZV64_70795 [Ignavibacteriales bacterium]|nr:hypothetical protein [Ignavibacteriales bacterium]